VIPTSTVTSIYYASYFAAQTEVLLGGAEDRIPDWKRLKTATRHRSSSMDEEGLQDLEDNRKFVDETEQMDFLGG